MTSVSTKSPTLVAHNVRASGPYSLHLSVLANLRGCRVNRFVQVVTVIPAMVVAIEAIAILVEIAVTRAVLVTLSYKFL